MPQKFADRLATAQEFLPNKPTPKSEYYCHTRQLKWVPIEEMPNQENVSSWIVSEFPQERLQMIADLLFHETLSLADLSVECVNNS